MKLRPLSTVDEAAVLALNAAEAHLDPLGPDRLDWLRLIAAHAAVVDVDGEVAGFVLTFAPGSAYDGLDFQWFAATYADRFLYLDRIVVAPAHRRQGIADLVYRAVERSATPFDRLVCGVRSDPPDEPALALHAARGFVEVGKLRHPEGTTNAMLSKELTD
ncbi:GCN5-related N-acetyltransferase [Kribbella flavida DSM 17836]|uniref:GCN5-related N-acetyltransferase n=1 Tax=Kribbella flavida (strain DSM 17836 / JCM 10339 / NBRC 14399) TaxID=479435 RepID=D2Q157_KRIFD|nr:GNAT family N-acetyltransferase [Kribbella flavida]ADB35758.1 GCN5-related N-acetyltransferase [Kribbella flavida DSM 17836]